MICTKLDEEHGILMQVAHGDIVLSDVVAAVNRRYRDPGYDAFCPTLWNVADAEWKGAHQEYSFVAEEISQWLKSRRPMGPVAVVFGNATDEALFNTLYAPADWMNFRSFTSLPKARQWLLSQSRPKR